MAQQAIDLAELLQDLHDSEISGTIDWLWHAGNWRGQEGATDAQRIGTGEG